jgi:hypothetical protein
MKTKIFCLIMVSIFTGSTIIPSINSNSIDNKIVSIDEDTQCYGFIVPIIKTDNYSKEYNTNIISYNLVNDLIREKIKVFWTSEDKVITVRNTSSDHNADMLFNKGSFIIPFLNNDTKNKMIISIIYDYNLSNEFDKKLSNIPIYQIMTGLSIQANELEEVKTAHYRTPFATDSEINFVNTAQKCGFFNIDFLNPNNIARINKEDYNFFIYGYGDVEVSPLCPPLNPFNGQYIFYPWEDIRYGVSSQIRKYVRNGGAYLGVCGGAQKATAGARGIPLKNYLKLAAIYPRLPTIGCLALINTVGSVEQEKSAILSLDIVNSSHPIAYGMDETVTDFYAGGPKFLEIGENVEIISKFTQDSLNNMSGFPSWITSKFGKGKVILSSSHPEIMDFFYQETGCRFISNTFFYGTFKEENLLNLISSKNISFIKNIYNFTTNLPNQNYEIINTTNLTSNLSNCVNRLKSLNQELNNSYNLIIEIMEKEGIELDSYSSFHFLGFFSIYVIKDRYLKYSITYLEDLINKISQINQIYNDSINNTDFCDILKDYIINQQSMLSDIDESINELFDFSHRFNSSLIDYKNSFFKKIKNRQVHDNLHLLTQSAPEFYLKIVKNYFNSLKLLRNNWYEYEVSLVK